ncbi:acetate--CoA ligase [Cupriavidus basilensis]|uniref:acetate--CoA ligase n=1 Tax=Cupriavidus basilensis TaxID=68895 RepID=A0A0C4Y9C3_9BURK|nr:acetate--CoA ligase [Cupriavidus basilensis]AJG19538.1 Acetyl-coenzyme A synthetase [Cupriavidus basilensis]
MESSSIIHKTASDLRLAPNLGDYEAERRVFSWAAVSRELADQPQGALNIAWQAVDRHAASSLRGKAAFRILARGTPTHFVTYGQLSALTNRFCNVLRDLGVGKGERLFILAGRIPELYIAILGSLKNGTAVSPLFSAFGPDPIATRVNLGEGAVLVTTDMLFERKIAKWRDRMPSLKHVLLVAEDGGTTAVPGTLDLSSLMASASDACEITPTTAEDMALLHFTSGTTGTPKGAVHVHGAVLTHWSTGRYALDLHVDDIYWCTADPGWVTGTSYGVIAPLLHGVTSIVDREEFDAERWYAILQDEGVSIWYTAPTAIRMLMKAGADIAKKYAFPRLRFAASVGEPLNPEAVWWGKQVLGLPFHDNWWQTETGGIMIANTPAFDIKPGSMGRPLPGVEAAIVSRQADGSVQVIEAPNKEGELALKRGWPSMFRGYLNSEERYRKSFSGEWYLTGDLARRDADGYYWFVGRADDVIKSAGHLIGPFEVESALMEHPAVAEAAVIGKPDPIAGEVVKAFVSLNNGFEQSEALRMALLGHARTRLGAAVAPKEIAFLTQLPRTRSGKIMRRLLKARELGLPEGDTSTLEAGP